MPKRPLDYDEEVKKALRRAGEHIPRRQKTNDNFSLPDPVKFDFEIRASETEIPIIERFVISGTPPPTGKESRGLTKKLMKCLYVAIEQCGATFLSCAGKGGVSLGLVLLRV